MGALSHGTGMAPISWAKKRKNIQSCHIEYIQVSLIIDIHPVPSIVRIVKQLNAVMLWIMLFSPRASRSMSLKVVVVVVLVLVVLLVLVTHYKFVNICIRKHRWRILHIISCIVSHLKSTCSFKQVLERAVQNA